MIPESINNSKICYEGSKSTLMLITTLLVPYDFISILPSIMLFLEYELFLADRKECLLSLKAK